jgi:hypothetical protein
MSFETPSDRFQARSRRFYALLKRFFLLHRLDSHKLLRTIWVFTLVVYGFQLLGWLLTVPSYFAMKSQFPGIGTWWQVFAPLLVAPIGPLLWLMIIRLVLEICARVLNELPGVSEQEDARHEH